MPQLPPYVPRTYLVHLPSSRRPLYCSVLPKLSLAQTIAIADELAKRGLTCSRRGKHLTIKKGGLYFSLEPVGVVMGAVDPLEVLPELFAAISKLRRRWTTSFAGKEGVSAWMNGYMRLMAFEREGRLDLLPRLERGGSAWAKNRVRYGCLLLPDELLVLSFAINKLKPHYVELLSYKPLARARPQFLHGRLFFINRVGYLRAVRLLREQAILHSDSSEAFVVPPPSLRLKLGRPRAFALGVAELRELWNALGRWCLDEAALLGSQW